MLQSPEEGNGTPGTEVTDSCGLPNVSAGIQTQVLWWSSMCFYPLSHLYGDDDEEDDDSKFFPLQKWAGTWEWYLLGKLAPLNLSFLILWLASSRVDHIFYEVGRVKPQNEARLG